MLEPHRSGLTRLGPRSPKPSTRTCRRSRPVAKNCLPVLAVVHVGLRVRCPPDSVAARAGALYLLPGSWLRQPTTEMAANIRPHAEGQLSGLPRQKQTFAARHAAIASSLNQTAKLPRACRAASYSGQLVTRCRCRGIRCCHSLFTLNGMPDPCRRRYRLPQPTASALPARSMHHALSAVNHPPP